MFKTLVVIGSIFGFAAVSQAQQAPIVKLLKEVKNQTVFTQTTANKSCPLAIQPVISDYPPEFAQAGDVDIYFNSAKPASGASPGWFTHEHNSLLYRPGLPTNVSNVLERSLNLPLGIAYRVASQTEKQNTLTYEFKAKIASIIGIGVVYSKVEYDSNNDLIKYHLAANGMDDVDCIFKK